MEKVVVTGAGGFVGSHLVKELLSRGVKVTATSTAKPWYLKNGLETKVKFAAADFKSGELKKIVEDHDTVFHAGALFSFWAPKVELDAVNVHGAHKLAVAAAEAGVKTFVNFSSGAIYGPGADATPVDEKTAVRPTDNYALSKWEGEQKAFAQNGRNGMRVVSLRPGAIYGPYSVYGDAMALWLLKRGLLIGVPGWATYVSSHVHVADCVNAAIHLAENDVAANASTPAEAAFNVCDDLPTPNEDLIRAADKAIRHKGLLGHFGFLRLPAPMLKLTAFFAELLAKATNTNPIFDRVSIDYIATHRALSNLKLKSTGFELKYPIITDGLGETIQWYEETGWRAFKTDRREWV